jgi:hypothetical protein
MNRATLLKAGSAVRELGFPELTIVSTLRTIAHLFGTTKERCGIYLLEFPEDKFYIGQAVDVVRRFAQHRHNYDDIVGFSFIPVPGARLDEIERDKIHRAELLGLALLNMIHATNVVGETDLDLVVSPKEQEAWLAGRGNMLSSDAGRIFLPETQKQRFAHKYWQFSTHHHADQCLAMLRQYVNNCIPSPRRTEYSFWAVSCMPATNRSTWPRLACVNAGIMELFVVGYHIEDPRRMWGFVNVATDVLGGDLWQHSHLQAMRWDIEVLETNYRDAGQHQVMLHANTVDALESLLRTEVVRSAAAALALRVMRKRATIFNKFHCPQLAEDILGAAHFAA